MGSTLTRTCVAIIVAILAVQPATAHAQGKDGKPELKIIKDDLLELDNLYFVKGMIYNPSDKPVKNVVIRYYIWKKWMAKKGTVRSFGIRVG